MTSPIEIFCCYARRDKLLLNGLIDHLTLFQRVGLICLWADTDINAGAEWEREIDKHLNTAQIILLLVSPQFMASDYCYSKEMIQVMERHRRGEASVIPIIIRPVDWQLAAFSKLQALPSGGAKPVTLWQNRDAAFYDIAQSIRKAAEALQKELDDLFASKQTGDSAKSHADSYWPPPFVEEGPPPIPEQTKRRMRILVVDDIKGWREELVETLQSGGFHVDSVSSADEALKLLDEAVYHLLITDIRQDVRDPNNIGGLVLLREMEKRGLNQSVKTIINSASGTMEHIREAFVVHKVLDFFSKEKFDNKLFLGAVQQAFINQMDINLALEIHWHQISKPEQVLLNLEVDGIKIQQGTPRQRGMVAELEDLLCRLYHRAERVLVRPLMQGHNRIGVLRIQPFYTRGSGHEVIVKFGDFHKIEEEHQNFKKNIQPLLGARRSTMILDMCRTSHLGCIVYSLIGTIDDQLMDFEDFYCHNDIPQIWNVLDNLFLDTCGVLYMNPGRLEPLDLVTEYQRLFDYSPDMLEKVVSKKLKSVQGNQRLYFHNLKRTFTNPLLAMGGLSRVHETYLCMTHGSLDQHNILIDSNGHTWLIDFQRTYRSHILRDVAMLDSMVRFRLLDAKEASIEERLQMEEALCSIERFSQIEQLVNALPTQNQPLIKCYTIVLHLRRIARKLVEPNDNIGQYYIALLYIAMNTLQNSVLSSVQREHALLCASLLTDQACLLTGGN